MKRLIEKIGVFLVAMLPFFAVASCGTPKYLPVEAKTEVRYIDSLRIKDSTVIHTQVLVKDYCDIPDTLRLQGEHSTATAYVDTSKNTLKGQLKEEPWKEKIVYRDRIEYRDSIKTVEVPVPVEVVKEVVPKWSWYSLVLNFVILLILLIRIFMKLKTH